MVAGNLPPDGPAPASGYSTGPNTPTAYSTVVLADTPVSYWRFGEASGLPQDSVGVNHVTAVTGSAPTYGVTGLPPSSTDKAMRFAGATMLSVNHAASLNVGDVFSIEFWLARSDPGQGNGDTVFFKGTTGGNPPVVFFIGDLPTLFNLGTGQNIAFCTAISDASAHHLVVTKSGASIHWYKDGVQTPDDIANTTAFGNSTEALRLASASGLGSPFNGTLDEIALYNYVLTPAKIAAHWAAR